MDKPKRKMPKGTPWQKGQSGNPKGRPPIPEEIREARKITQAEFERICGKLFYSSVDNLKRVVNDDRAPVMEALVARILLKGIEESSRVELNYFIERFLGKVPEERNVKGSLGGLLADFIGGRDAEVQPESEDNDDEDDE
jgi:transcriptional regulator with XRE-family HTH domain